MKPFVVLLCLGIISPGVFGLSCDQCDSSNCEDEPATCETDGYCKKVDLGDSFRVDCASECTGSYINDILTTCCQEDYCTRPSPPRLFAAGGKTSSSVSIPYFSRFLVTTTVIASLILRTNIVE